MWGWGRKLPRSKIIHFILRNNRIYRILFRGTELFIDDKLTWTQENEEIDSDRSYSIKFIGTSPQDFRQRAKKRTSKGRGKIPDKGSPIERG